MKKKFNHRERVFIMGSDGTRILVPASHAEAYVEVRKALIEAMINRNKELENIFEESVK